MEMDNGPLTEQPPVVQLRHEFAIISEENETVASATVERMNGVQWLTNVWTHHKYRRRAYASRVLKAVVANFGADDLWLKIHPYTDRPRNEVQLADFYGRFGFVSTDVPGVMRRAGNSHRISVSIASSQGVDPKQLANAVVAQIERKMRSAR